MNHTKDCASKRQCLVYHGEGVPCPNPYPCDCQKPTTDDATKFVLKNYAKAFKDLGDSDKAEKEEMCKFHSIMEEQYGGGSENCKDCHNVSPAKAPSWQTEFEKECQHLYDLIQEEGDGTFEIKHYNNLQQFISALLLSQAEDLTIEFQKDTKEALKAQRSAILQEIKEALPNKPLAYKLSLTELKEIFSTINSLE